MIDFHLFAKIENLFLFKIISTDKFFHGSGIYSTDKQQDEKAFSSIIYYEPESKVISRSGDICIVSLSDQWFIDYGNEEVKAVIKKYVFIKFLSIHLILCSNDCLKDNKIEFVHTFGSV